MASVTILQIGFDSGGVLPQSSYAGYTTGELAEFARELDTLGLARLYRFTLQVEDSVFILLFAWWVMRRMENRRLGIALAITYAVVDFSENIGLSQHIGWAWWAGPEPDVSLDTRPFVSILTQIKLVLFPMIALTALFFPRLRAHKD